MRCQDVAFAVKTSFSKYSGIHVGPHMLELFEIKTSVGYKL